jgi:hypothetical protein
VRILDLVEIKPPRRLLDYVDLRTKATYEVKIPLFALCQQKGLVYLQVNHDGVECGSSNGDPGCY